MNLFSNIKIFKIECGPEDDRRTLTMSLNPLYRNVGILLSGGIDSAIIYYIIMKLNHNLGYTHKITPYTILRKEGSPVHAPLIIEYVNGLFGFPFTGLNVVGDNTISEGVQVNSGINELFDIHKVNMLYLGSIETLDIHTVGWEPPRVITETTFIKSPLGKFNKSHVIDLVVQLKQEKIFELSHSCVHPLGRCYNCNGCNERTWGFNRMGYSDPGII